MPVTVAKSCAATARTWLYARVNLGRRFPDEVAGVSFKIGIPGNDKRGRRGREGGEGGWRNTWNSTEGVETEGGARTGGERKWWKKVPVGERSEGYTYFHSRHLSRKRVLREDRARPHLLPLMSCSLLVLLSRCLRDLMRERAPGSYCHCVRLYVRYSIGAR